MNGAVTGTLSGDGSVLLCAGSLSHDDPSFTSSLPVALSACTVFQSFLSSLSSSSLPFPLLLFPLLLHWCHTSLCHFCSFLPFSFLLFFLAFGVISHVHPFFCSFSFLNYCSSNPEPSFSFFLSFFLSFCLIFSSLAFSSFPSASLLIPYLLSPFLSFHPFIIFLFLSSSSIHIFSVLSFIPPSLPHFSTFSQLSVIFLLSLFPFLLPLSSFQPSFHH